MLPEIRTPNVAGNALQSYAGVRQMQNALQPQQATPEYNALAAYGGPTVAAGNALNYRDAIASIKSALAAYGGPTVAAGNALKYRDAIASIESDGSGGYTAVGRTHPTLGRALGRYQIMEANIPVWSREILGREVSPEEFMANPALQDAIFDGKFGAYVNQYGPEGAAQAWFAGPGGVGKLGRRDVLGTSVGDYTTKFSRALGGLA